MCSMTNAYHSGSKAFTELASEMHTTIPLGQTCPLFPVCSSLAACFEINSQGNLHEYSHQVLWEW